MFVVIGCGGGVVVVVVGGGGGDVGDNPLGVSSLPSLPLTETPGSGRAEMVTITLPVSV